MKELCSSTLEKEDLAAWQTPQMEQWQNTDVKSMSVGEGRTLCLHQWGLVLNFNADAELLMLVVILFAQILISLFGSPFDIPPGRIF